MVSKRWLNLLVWGLGDRLEKKNDYKTDILMVLNIMTWYSLALSASALKLNLLAFWLLSIVIVPEAWIGTQLGVGYIMVKKAEPQVQKRETTAEQTPVLSVGASKESEEP
jgi:hypothetical protein